MTTELFAISFIASILMIIVLLVICGKQNITYYLLMFIAIAISNLGSLVTISSKSLDVAILGNSMTYLGAVLTSVLVILCFIKLCKMQISRFFIYCLLAFGAVILYFVFTVEYNGYYYKSVEWATENGMAYLIKDYGPMHTAFYVFLVICILTSTSVIVYAMSKKTKVSYRVIVLLAIIDCATIFCYIMKNALALKYDILPVVYIIDEIIILILLRRISMYEISENIAKALEEHSTYGYVVFDKYMRYAGCNDMAKVYFPELEYQKIDYKLNENDSPFLYECFSECMNDPDDVTDDCEHMIESNDLILKCAVKDLHYGTEEKKKIGYLIEIVDETQQQKYMKLLNNYNADLSEEVRKKSERISKFQDKLILSMADMVENRDNNTGGHIKRTSKVIRIFTKELLKYKNDINLTATFLENVAKAAPMHDLGKIAVDDAILRKPGKFTPEEFEEMKKHSEKGAEIVEQLLEGLDDTEFIEISKNVAHYHHEKWNGAGYPEGLVGEAIPIEARIMALADVFDALVSKRCYKEKMDYDKAFSIIEESSGSHFEPRLAEIFMSCRLELEAYYNTIED